MPAAAQSTADCRSYFHADDPRLYDFVEIRSSVDYHEFAEMRIGTVEVVVLPIFNEDDPDEDIWLYRLANRVHIDTRDTAIHKQLTFATGQQLERRVIRENERLLRGNRYLSDAMILPGRVCGDTINLLVVVHDVWTLSPDASVSRTGGDNESSFGISESNILGTGQRGGIGYSKGKERDSVSVTYTNDQLFENHSRLDLGYEDNSDGNVKEVALTRPFYSLDSTWSAGVSGVDESRIEDIEGATQTINRYDHIIKDYQAFYGWSAGIGDDRVVRRWRVGIGHEKDEYSQLDPTSPPPPPNKRLVYPWLSFESVEDRYLTTSNISTIHRLEDLLLGAIWSARIGYAAPATGSTEEAVLFNLSNRYTTSYGRHHLLQLNGSAGGRFNLDTDSLLGSVAELGATYYFFQTPVDRWVATLQFQAAKNVAQDEQLTIGGEDDLLGYPDEMQRGNRRWQLGLERRHFYDMHIFNLLRVGAAAYVEMGEVWDTESSELDSSLLANVGLGLRLTPSKGSRDRVVHMDIAVPLTERNGIDSYQIILTGETEF